MIRSVDFLSRAKAESLPPRQDIAIVSITEPDSSPASLPIHEDRILRLVFHDVDPYSVQEDCWRYFDEGLAMRLLAFVRDLHADPAPYDLVVHCRAGISRSAAIALFVEAETGCSFSTRPFAGLANRHVLETMGQVTALELKRPRALPRRENFSVSVLRDFESGRATVTVENKRSCESVALEGPMLEVSALAAAGIERVGGVANPPASYHVSDWDSLDGSQS